MRAQSHTSERSAKKVRDEDSRADHPVHWPDCDSCRHPRSRDGCIRGFDSDPRTEPGASCRSCHRHFGPVLAAYLVFDDHDDSSAGGHRAVQAAVTALILQPARGGWWQRVNPRLPATCRFATKGMTGRDGDSSPPVIRQYQLMMANPPAMRR